MLKPEHISAYSLIIEEGTPFWNRFGEKNCSCGYTGPALPDEDTENKIYRFTRKFLQNRALSAMRYLTMQNREKPAAIILVTGQRLAYLGIGLGASSYMEGCRFTNERDLDKYLALDFGSEVPEEREAALKKLWGPIEELTQAQRMEEFMFLGLRMLRGVSDVDFIRLFWRENGNSLRGCDRQADLQWPVEKRRKQPCSYRMGHGCEQFCIK